MQSIDNQVQKVRHTIPTSPMDGLPTTYKHVRLKYIKLKSKIEVETCPHYVCKVLPYMSVWNLRESALYEGMTENRGEIKGTMDNDVNKYIEIILAELFTS